MKARDLEQTSVAEAMLACDHLSSAHDGGPTEGRDPARAGACPCFVTLIAHTGMLRRVSSQGCITGPCAITTDRSKTDAASDAIGG